MYQLTKNEAIIFGESGEWKAWDAFQICKFQLFQEKLCVPFSTFHEAVEIALNRPVFSHEFANSKALRGEFLGTKDAPTLKDIFDMLPDNSVICVFAPHKRP